MRILSSVAAQIDALIPKPPDVTWLDQRRQLAFVTEKLALSALAVAAAPFLVLLVGVPSSIEVCLFALLCMPLIAAAFVMRSGDLFVGEMISLGGLAGAGLLVGLEAQRGSTAAALLMLAMAVDGAFLFNDWRRTSLAPLMATLVAAIVLSSRPTAAMPAEIAAIAVFLAAAAILATAFRTQSIFRDLQTAAARDRYRFNALVEVSGGIVATLDRSGAVQQTAAALSCRLPIPNKGESLASEFDKGERQSFAALLDTALVNGAGDSGNFRSIRSAVPLDLSLAAVNGDGPDEIIALVRQTVTKIRDELPIAPTAQSPGKQDGSELKTEFLANVSHELRTPLNAIIGFSEMLASHTIRPIEQEKQREYATIIYESGQHLLAVINSILDMSKLRSGTFKLICEPFEVAPLVKQCCDMVKLKAEANRVTIAVKTKTQLGEFDGDRRALKQILLNLLSNAVRFTPEGGNVSIELDSDEDHLSVSVSDTGIGISETDLAKLGQPFFQARSSLCRPFEGTGLGLSVVRGLVDLQGGSFSVASRLGSGTKVTVTLPRSQSLIAETDSQISLRDPSSSAGSPWAVPDWMAASELAQPRMKQIA